MTNICDPRLYHPLQRIYTYLDISDLKTLSCVSRRFHSDIEHAYKTICLRLSLKENVEHLLYRPPLLRRDNEIRRLFNRVDYSYKWLYAIWRKYKRIYRKPIKDINFHLKGRESNIPILYDDYLGRDVVVIRQICWLHLEHVFINVVPGNYRACIRMEVNYVTWGCHANPAIFRVYWYDVDGYREKRAEVKSQLWRSVRSHLIESNTVRLDGAILLNYDDGTGWFDFTLEDITVSTTTDVCVEFKDTENNWWKEGMRWDYLEMVPS